jgi:hypothetical protein
MRATLRANVALLQLERSEDNKAVRDEVRAQRAKQADNKVEGLQLNQEAAGLRGEAENIKAGCNAAASAIGVAAACCAFIPVVGPIIAAVLAAVAAIIVLIGQIMAKGLEDQAAAKEREAGQKDLMADKHKNDAEDVKKIDEERTKYVDQFREKLIEMNKESAGTAKF